MKNTIAINAKSFTANSVTFGLLLPVVMLLKPQVEAHIKKEGVNMTSSGNKELQEIMERPCSEIAKPIASCLIKEAEGSGKLLGIISDLISKNYGVASEHVTKRCIAKTLNMPPDSLSSVPLKRLIENMEKKPERSNESREDKCPSQLPVTPPIK